MNTELNKKSFLVTKRAYDILGKAKNLRNIFIDIGKDETKTKSKL